MFPSGNSVSERSKFDENVPAWERRTGLIAAFRRKSRKLCIKDSKVWRGILAGATGLEPATFGVTGRQFNLNIQDAFQLLKRRNEPKHPDQLEREARLTSGKKRALGLGVSSTGLSTAVAPCELPSWQWAPAVSA
jgi:hypothetical protein